jgi:hypothetical protein
MIHSCVKVTEFTGEFSTKCPMREAELRFRRIGDLRLAGLGRKLAAYLVKAAATA